MAQKLLGYEGLMGLAGGAYVVFPAFSGLADVAVASLAFCAYFVVEPHASIRLELPDW